MDQQIRKSSVILLLGLAGFMVIADNWVISPILPAIAESLNIDIPNAGLLITAYMIPFGIFQIIFGALADRYGKKQVITFSMIMFTIATGLCAVGTSLTSVGFFRALTGIFAASVMPISFALIGDLFPMHERQQAIGTFISISFLGQGLSMAMGGIISKFFNWHGVFLVYALLSLIPTTLLIKNYHKIPSQKNPNSEIFKPYMQLLSNPSSLFTYIIIMLEGAFIVGSFSFGGSYVSQIFHYNSMQIGFIMTGFGIMSVIGARFCGKIAKSIGPMRLLWGGLFLAAAGNTIVYLFGSNISAFILGIATLGLGFIFAHSTLITRATGFARKARGAAMSLVAFSFMGSGGVGAAIGGRIIGKFGIDSIFLICGVGLFVTLVLSCFLLNGEEHVKVPVPNEIRRDLSEQNA